jgi:hypothetical protein
VTLLTPRAILFTPRAIRRSLLARSSSRRMHCLLGGSARYRGPILLCPPGWLRDGSSQHSSHRGRKTRKKTNTEQRTGTGMRNVRHCPRPGTDE